MRVYPVSTRVNRPANEGPELIEGNHDWCKLLWQLPVNKGLKHVLEKYKNELTLQQ